MWGVECGVTWHRWLGGKQHLDEASAKEHLHDLLDDGEHAGMVDAHALLEQRGHPHQLRELAVLRLEP